MRRSILFLIILFLIIAGVSLWYWRGNIYSKEVLKLEILSSATAQAGQEVEYLVKFKNNGKTRLEQAELVFEFPEKAMASPVASSTSQYSRVSQAIEDIYPGEERVVSFSCRVFGKENDSLEAKAWLSYQPKNLKARYESKTSFITQISFVPLTFEFDLAAKAEPGEDLEFSLNYFSNMQTVLDNIRVKIFYPEGFVFLTAKPKPLDQNEWKVEPLSTADGGRVTIKGNLSGQESEKKMFRAELGIVKDSQFISLKETSQGVEITQPSLRVSQMINGEQNYIADVGDMLHYEIFFRNIGKKPIEKKFLTYELQGDFFDLNSLKSLEGEFGKGDNSIIWDWQTVSVLRYLDPDEEAKVDFWIKVKDGLSGRKIKNPLLIGKITAGGAQKTFETKINSRFSPAQSVFYQDAKFQSSGFSAPLGKLPTYTVLWKIENSWNDLTNVKIKAVLSENVRPTGRIFPLDAKFTFDISSREIIWAVGDVIAFNTFEPLVQELWFQVEYDKENPLLLDSGILINDAEMIAQDAFTSEILSERAKALDISSAQKAQTAATTTPQQ